MCIIELLCVLFVCKCVFYYCQRMSKQLRLTNISLRANLFKIDTINIGDYKRKLPICDWVQLRLIQTKYFQIYFRKKLNTHITSTLNTFLGLPQYLGTGINNVFRTSYAVWAIRIFLIICYKFICFLIFSQTKKLACIQRFPWQLEQYRIQSKIRWTM